MKRKLFIILLAGLMVAPAGLMAQKVYNATGGGYTRLLLDMTDMPAGAITATSKGSGATLASVAANETVFQRLEIAKQDMAGTNAAPALAATGTDMTWADANTRCEGLTYNGRDNWRLPTQRELMMMWIFRTAINTLSGTSFYSSYYWSATESNVNDAWYVYFAGGDTYGNVKATSYRVRCVSEF